MQTRVLMIDNFDSFTFNLVDDLEKSGARVFVVRNNRETSEIQALVEKEKITHLVLSPGAGSPENAGNCVAFIQQFKGLLPMLGICLGMQAMVVSFGGHVSHCREMVHGRSGFVRHNGESIFSNIESPMLVGRYHSLSASRVPNELTISAEIDNIVMAVENFSLKLFGVQFHPESILSAEGIKLIENFLSYRIK